MIALGKKNKGAAMVAAVVNDYIDGNGIDGMYIHIYLFIVGFGNPAYPFRLHVVVWCFCGVCVG